MGKIIVSLNVSLDGVVEDPTGEEGFTHGGWFGQSGGKDLEELAPVLYAEALATEALLLGRRTDESFAARWTGRTGDWADRLNSMPKYVVSSTLVEPQWSNATVLPGDAVEEVTALKQKLDGDLVVYGSIQLARTLLEHDLADELRLIVFPIMLGAGERLLTGAGHKQPLRLTDTQTIGRNLVLLTYQPDREALA